MTDRHSNVKNHKQFSDAPAFGNGTVAFLHHASHEHQSRQKDTENLQRSRLFGTPAYARFEPLGQLRPTTLYPCLTSLCKARDRVQEANCSEDLSGSRKLRRLEDM